MRSKKEKPNIFWEGFLTSFDLCGFGFKRDDRISHINKSWHNVGVFFTTGFNDYKLLDHEQLLESYDPEVRE